MKLFKKKYSDERLILGIKSEEEIWKGRIYWQFKSRIKGHCNNYFQHFDATFFENAYDDAFMALEVKIRKEDFELNSQLFTFFTSIFNYKYIDQQRRKKVNFDELDDLKINLSKLFAPSILDRLISQEHLEQTKKLLKKAGKNCLEIILLHFSDQRPYKEIAELLQFKNADVVKKRKYTCMSRLYKEFETLKIEWYALYRR
jgi:RNA polymerase sigma factor (sigma-70 family)